MPVCQELLEFGIFPQERGGGSRAAASGLRGDKIQSCTLFQDVGFLAGLLKDTLVPLGLTVRGSGLVVEIHSLFHVAHAELLELRVGT